MTTYVPPKAPKTMLAICKPLPAFLDVPATARIALISGNTAKAKITTATVVTTVLNTSGSTVAGSYPACLINSSRR